ncbi:MAG: VOC family protein, partial [Pseudomonadota bacterium]
MAHGDFVWCDLSTFDVAGTRDFYGRLFGWSYDRIPQPDGSPYDVASINDVPQAGVFEMPEKFQKIGLPSFWMSYIQVDDAAAIVDLARQLGGKVEVGPIPYGEGALVALIRDPLGAGFTVYQGSDLSVRAQD